VGDSFYDSEEIIEDALKIFISALQKKAIA
jgi:hypothetical protein